MPEFHSRETLYLYHVPNGPNVFVDTHYGEYKSQGIWCEPQDFMNNNLYLENRLFCSSILELPIVYVT